MRAQALTVPRAIMLFSALLMAILIVRMVGYHYTVSDRQQQTFRFMLKATDIAKKLISSSTCLSHETFLYRGVIEREKLDEFARNYTDYEPLCAYDYDLGWRAKVIEKSFTYVSPAVLTTLNFAPGKWMNASELILMSPYLVNISITNSSGNTYLEEVDHFKKISVNQVVKFSSPYRLWAATINYLNSTPRETTPIAAVGPALCSDELNEFYISQYSNADPSGLLAQLDTYQVLLFVNSSGYMFLQENQQDWLDFLSDGNGIIALDDSFTFWGEIFDQSPLAMGFHSACEIPQLSENCTLKSGVYFNRTIPENLAAVIDLVRAKTPGDVISMYGLKFMTFAQNKIWVIPESENTRVRITDLSDGDDFADLRLDSQQSKYLTGFENDFVEVEASRPVWTISGDLGGYTWLQGSHLVFPSFGSFAVIAPKSTTISISPTNSGSYRTGIDFNATTLTLPDAGFFRVNKTHESGFRWISLNSTLPVIVETWDNHGMIEKLSTFTGEEHELITMGIGNITICPGGHAVSLDNGDEIYPYNQMNPACSRVTEAKELYRFVSEEPFLMVQSIGGDEASQIVQPQEGDDAESSAIAQATGADIVEYDSPMSSYNLFYLYRAQYPANLPSSRKGTILLYNSPEIFSQFGVSANPVSSGCVNWTINPNVTLFSKPINITEEYLEANPFFGCTFFHTTPSQTNFASSPDHNLERIIDFGFRNGEPLLFASLKPYRCQQLQLLHNLGYLVSENIFTAESTFFWEFGSSASSVGPAKRQEILLKIPVAIYYNESKVKPGEIELRVFDGELEKLRGAVERVCMENITEVMEIGITYPVSVLNRTLCQSGACKPLLCGKNVSLNLNAGFRIIKVSSNETGVFMG